MRLPEPQDAAKQHSLQVQKYLQEVLRSRGSIPFHDYMQIALYAPGLGYYSAGAYKLGEGGDFITAPEISPGFGNTIAQSLLPIIHELHTPDWLELGAGTGKLAESILNYLHAHAFLPKKYFILEVSADLKQRQQNYLQKNLSQKIFARLVWLDTLPKNFSGIIIGNEVLDALPVHRFKITAKGVQEIFAQYDQERLVETLKPAEARLRQRVEALRLPIDYESEINLQQEALIKSLSECLTQGVILFIDYGFPAREYYHPDRHQGTLMCHYQHHSHSDPYYYPGLQDITAHVNFTALAKAGIEAGLSLITFATQEAWLLHNSITEFCKDAQALHKLVSPAEMGELFKFIVFGKKIKATLPFVAQIDQRHRL